ncbi:lyase family protein [Jannaschia ovalis]|uniref:Lyase family protein n=1 Tax=Jannaschia ovalis TaxID=3038773 RepID=A0ABY8LER1_9RHOB|nr:lyase family protein [Jannaschia sp. GRR-S6-38]WGH79776.1 lyase family protein [Jannaschia sp. GRR-S6-38]
MSVSPFDSALHGESWADRDVARLFSDGAEIRAMLIVWGALASAQAAEGLVPEVSAQAIHRAAMEVAIDPAGLAAETAADGVSVPGLLRAFRAAMNAPEHARWVHHGATSQDLIDTGAALRLRQALALMAERLDAALATLADLAEAHAETPMAARTYGQVATPSSFGAAVAVWGEGLLAARDALPALREAVEIVTLNGASGTLSAMGEAGPRIRGALAGALGLRDPGRSPHAGRSHVRALAQWLNAVLRACDKPATDLLLLARDGSVTLAAGGASSTMPQKRNPVAPSQIRALAIHGAALAHGFDAAHWDQRDGGAWFAEWLSLPPLVTGAARALTLLGGMRIAPDAARLRAPLDDPSGLIHAEAVSFALDLPRPEAQARVKAWVTEIRERGGSLIEMAGLDSDAFAPERQWGEAPALARRFARAARGAER